MRRQDDSERRKENVAEPASVIEQDKGGAQAVGRNRSDIPMEIAQPTDSVQAPQSLDAPLDSAPIQNRSRVSPSAPAPLEARDLGDGANGEKLGDPRRPRGDSRYLEDGFTRTASRGGDASTFAIDVNTASFTRVRAELDAGRLPDPAIVHAEEFVNAFRYDYPQPGWMSDQPFRFSTETVRCPWTPSHQVVRVAVASKAMDAKRRPPANLVFLIDVSGSMSDQNKLPLLKDTFELLVDQLREDDRVAIVTYAGEAGVVLDPTPGDQKRTIMRAIDRLGAGGSTNGADGINTAYKLARQNFRANASNRVILATDGDFNVGATSNDALVDMIRREANSGIFLTTLGFGMGNYQDDRMKRLADDGNGINAYVDSMQEARRLFVEQLPASLVPLAQDVKIQVFFNPTTVAAWKLIGYETRILRREDFNNDRVSAGLIGVGHAVTALYEIVPVGAATTGSDPNPFVANDPTRDEPAQERVATGDCAMRLRLRWQPLGGGTSTLMEQDVPAVRDAESRASRDTSWALAMAGFAMKLSDGRTNTCDWRTVEHLAEAGQGGPDANARADAQRMIEQARRIDTRN
jgi:Ca-activated chloride channel family protein